MLKLIGSRSFCLISSVILIVSSIDLGGNLYNTPIIDDRIIYLMALTDKQVI